MLARIFSLSDDGVFLLLKTSLLMRGGSFHIKLE